MAPRPLVLRCRLCAKDGLLIEVAGGSALYDAFDHALDEHRAFLLRWGVETLDYITVTA